MRAADLPISNPCGLDFSKMTRAEANKRFCGACKKHVHDLTILTEDEAKALLSSPRTENLCIRYAADSRGRVVFVPDVPTTRLTSLKKRGALAAAALAAAATATGCANQMMMGDMPSPPGATSMVGRTSYELARGTTHVSVTDVPGVLTDMTLAANSPGCTRPNRFVSGLCMGDEPGCEEVKKTLDAATSPDDFVGRLQLAGFTVVQRTTHRE